MSGKPNDCTSRMYLYLIKQVSRTLNLTRFSWILTTILILFQVNIHVNQGRKLSFVITTQDYLFYKTLYQYRMYKSNI